MHHRHRAIVLSTCLSLAACGADKTAATSGHTDPDGLPQPVAAGGSVTGMPDPGSPSAPPAPVPAGPVPAAQDGLDAGVTEDAGEASVMVPEANPPMRPHSDVAGDADAAVRVLLTYHAAINARDYAAAYAQWSDGGRASGQSAQQFADGYAGTQGVSVALGKPGLIEGAAGSSYIEIPATLEATQADGSLRRYAGSFSLRRTVVDGASEAQRHWHIASASLREMRP